MKVYYCCVRVWDEDFHPLRSRLVARTSPKMPAPLFMVETDLYRVAGSSKKRNKGCLRSVIKPPNRGLRIGGNVVRAARLCIPLFFGAATHNRCNRRFWAVLRRWTAVQRESSFLSFTSRNLLRQLGRKVLLWNRKRAACLFRAAVSRFGFSHQAGAVPPTKRLRKTLSWGACVRNSGHRVGSNRLHDRTHLSAKNRGLPFASVAFVIVREHRGGQKGR